MTRVNRLLATIWALGLLALGLLTVAELVLVALDRPGWVVSRIAWDRRLATTAWSDTWAWATGFGLVALGLVVVAVALRASRPRYWRTTEANVLVSDRAVQSWAERAARDADPTVEVRVDARRAQVTVRAGEAGGGRAVEHVHAALATLELAPFPSVRTTGSST